MQILRKETFLAPYEWLIHDINIKNEQNDLTSLTDPNQPITTDLCYLSLPVNNITAKLTNQFSRTGLSIFYWQ